MSVKIKLSYISHEELQCVCQHLKPLIKKIRLQPPKGQYRRAYIDLKDIPTNTGNRSGK